MFHTDSCQVDQALAETNDLKRPNAETRESLSLHRLAFIAQFPVHQFPVHQFAVQSLGGAVLTAIAEWGAVSTRSVILLYAGIRLQKGTIQGEFKENWSRLHSPSAI